MEKLINKLLKRKDFTTNFGCVFLDTEGKEINFYSVVHTWKTILEVVNYIENLKKHYKDGEFNVFSHKNVTFITCKITDGDIYDGDEEMEIELKYY